MKNKDFSNYIQIVDIDRDELLNWFMPDEEVAAQSYLRQMKDKGIDSAEIVYGNFYIPGCKSCHDPDAYERRDFYGISTGRWCDDCYNSNRYPYRKDNYPTVEHDGYGEYLGDDDEDFFDDPSYTDRY